MAAIIAVGKPGKGGLQKESQGPQINMPKEKLQCLHCLYRTDCWTKLKVHKLRIHNAEKPFKCSFCPFKSTSHDHLQNHCRIHTGEKPFKCLQCKRDFSGSQSLKSHVLIRHSKIKARPYRCEKIGCESTFRFKDGLRIHIQKVHKKGFPEKRLACGLCPKILKTDTSLQIHLRTHTGEKPFKCSECDFAAGQQTNVDNHVKMHHSEVYDFPCNVPGCEAKFKLKHHWKHHVDIVHKKVTRFRCPDCPKEFFNKYLTKMHYRRFHSKEKPYECDLCEHRVGSYSEIRSHKRYIHGEYMNSECPDCDRKFKNADTLRQHRNKKHTGKTQETKLFPCLESGCGKEYRTKYALKSHILRCHTEDSKQFSCPFCPHTSISLPNLMIHIRRHTGEAPYKCDDCGKCFRDSSMLRAHKQHIHSQERPFKCTLCAYQGKTRGNLREHLKTHNPNPIKRFSCSVCSYKFTTKTILKRHSVSHQQERPFACQLCSFKAKFKHVLWKHMKGHAAHKLYTCSECQGAFETEFGLRRHQRACRFFKIQTLGSDAPTAKDCKPCFVRVVRLKL